MIIPRPQLTNSAVCGSVINLLPSPVRPHATHCPTMLHINVSSFSWPTPPAKVWSAVPVDAICATWPITFGISKYGQILMEKLKTLHLLGWLYQRIVYQVWQWYMISPILAYMGEIWGKHMKLFIFTCFTCWLLALEPWLLRRILRLFLMILYTPLEGHQAAWTQLLDTQILFWHTAM